MKLICTQENLSRGLQLVSHIASKNISLPILSNVLIEVKKGDIKLSTTNLEMGIVCEVRGKVEAEGAFTVQAKTISDYINLLPKENVTLELVDQNLKIQSENSKTLMKGLEASEFPLIPQVDPETEIEIKGKILKNALNAVSFAVSYDETRPEINGVFFSFNEKKLTLVATDSYRLAEKSIDLENNIPEKGFIVPIKTIQELVRIIDEEEEMLKIKISDNQILFLVGGAQLSSRLIEGQYPDYKQIIPTEQKTSITLDTTDFINTIKRASLFCKAGSNDILLKFLVNKNEVHVSANNLQIGESEAKQSADVEGQDNDIIFNYRFLLEGLQNIEEPECILNINTNTNPGLLKPKKESNYVYIIMPIKQ
ncbi:MAG: DNA polymerase III subunit beta [bacterium]|nr:DNA polymerase III subunit beta [bacterium]